MAEYADNKQPQQIRLSSDKAIQKKNPLQSIDFRHSFSTQGTLVDSIRCSASVKGEVAQMTQKNVVDKWGSFIQNKAELDTFLNNCIVELKERRFGDLITKLKKYPWNNIFKHAIKADDVSLIKDTFLEKLSNLIDEWNLDNTLEESIDLKLFFEIKKILSELTPTEREAVDNDKFITAPLVSGLSYIGKDSRRDKELLTAVTNFMKTHGGQTPNFLTRFLFDKRMPYSLEKNLAFTDELAKKGDSVLVYHQKIVSLLTDFCRKEYPEEETEAEFVAAGVEEEEAELAPVEEEAKEIEAELTHVKTEQSRFFNEDDLDDDEEDPKEEKEDSDVSDVIWYVSSDDESQPIRVSSMPKKVEFDEVKYQEWRSVVCASGFINGIKGKNESKKAVFTKVVEKVKSDDKIARLIFSINPEFFKSDKWGTTHEVIHLLGLGYIPTGVNELKPSSSS